MHAVKAYARHSPVILIFVLISFFLLFHRTPEISKKSVPQSLGVEVKGPGSPVRLRIPAIHVNASIQHTGVTALGAMETPSNTDDVGWLKLGSRPGEKGSAVIAGHFDGRNGEAAVFTRLSELNVGDTIYIEDSNGVSISFVVRTSHAYDPGFAEEVFSLNDSAHLNLITCDGVWDEGAKSYSKRLVVFADITHVSHHE